MLFLIPLGTVDEAADFNDGGVPKGNRTYVDATTSGESAYCGLNTSSIRRKIRKAEAKQKKTTKVSQEEP